MKKLFLAIASAAVVLSAGPAAAMDVGSFLQRADRLMRLGPLAMSEYRVLSAEISRSNAILRAERLAAERQGRRPAYCPDAARPAGPGEIFRALKAIPVAERADTRLTDALRTFYARRNPCPA